MEKIRSMMDSSEIGYRFYANEQKAIVDGLKVVIKKLYTKKERIEMHPKNEGQVTYAVKVDEIQSDINDLEGIVKEFE